MTDRLAGRVALISGGNSGIGRATAVRFAQEGARVMIAARSREKAIDTLTEIVRLGGEASFIPCNVQVPDDCQRAVDFALESFDRIDILFNNAGVVPQGTVLTTSIETWIDAFATNVHGMYYLSRAALPIMIAQGSGVIVNNASDWAIVGAQNAAAYAATKGAVVQLTRSMALDHARQGIRVNAICPGDTLVDRWRDAAHRNSVDDEGFDRQMQKLGQSFPLRRVGRVEEIANAVVFLASDESSYMTGQILVIDGGNTAGGVSAAY